MEIVHTTGGGRKPSRSFTSVLKWNGERIKRARFVNYRVTVDEHTPTKAWYLPFEGTIRQGVEVIPKKGEPFFLDNHDGSAFVKMEQGGLFTIGHKTANGEVLEEVPYDQVNTVIIPEKYAEVLEKNRESMNDEQWEQALKIIDQVKKKAAEREQVLQINKGQVPKVKKRDLKRHDYFRKHR